MKRNVSLCLILLLSLILLISGCKSSDNYSNNSQIKVNVDYPIAYDINNLINSSTNIVKGHFTRYIDTWNMARNPDNLQEEDKNVRIEGRLFEFVINKELKGNMSKKEIITVNLPYSHYGVIDELYVEPVLDENVTLFLKYDSDFKCYYPAIEPYQFIVKDNELKVKSNNKKVALEFNKKEITSKNLEKLINK